MAQQQRRTVKESDEEMVSGVRQCRSFSSSHRSPLRLWKTKGGAGDDIAQCAVGQRERRERYKAGRG